ncbi:hypothetical protein AVEN_94029-1 [Araneus ventricosus]|uniref:Uncharacterized protein n=1 Tax=Araneus ventricosus TaxID=182803 RepID=A0A4Y2QWZ6_ARAVE|nr:hypothetical protein AVEN_103496-1 [Araneus ventricosus]GBN67887.1 hypothetical protein AVEN_94029-1 [Araneus ventricosus]
MLPRHSGGLDFWGKDVHPCLIACEDPEKKVISLSLVPRQVFEAYCHSCSLVIWVPKDLTKNPTGLQPRSCNIRPLPFYYWDVTSEAMKNCGRL